MPLRIGKTLNFAVGEIRFGTKRSSVQITSPRLFLLFDRAVVQRSGKVKAVEVHHLGPGFDEVVDELLAGVGASVDFGQGAELRVGAEDEVDTRAGPLHFATLAATTFEYVGFF